MDRVEFIFWFGDEETEIQQLRHSKGGPWVVRVGLMAISKKTWRNRARSTGGGAVL